MTRDDVRDIINAEELVRYNFFEDRHNTENEIVICYNAGQWFVYATDERASKIIGSEKKFDAEDKALENFVKRLRALNIIKKSL